MQNQPIVGFEKAAPFTMHEEKIKTSPRRYPFANPAPILVASMGRSGSTLVFKTLVKGVAKARFGPLGPLFRKRIGTDAMDDLSDQKLLRGTVYKTHALAEEYKGDGKAKIVFVFGKASDAALSVLSCRQRFGDEWVKSHFRHLRANGCIEKLLRRDVLRFEEQIDGWLSVTTAPLLALRYDSLWKNTDVISDFVGFDITFPEKRRRNTYDVIDDEELISLVRNTYADLDRKISGYPQYILSNTELL